MSVKYQRRHTTRRTPSPTRNKPAQAVSQADPPAQEHIGYVNERLRLVRVIAAGPGGPRSQVDWVSYDLDSGEPICGSGRCSHTCLMAWADREATAEEMARIPCGRARADGESGTLPDIIRQVREQQRNDVIEHTRRGLRVLAEQGYLPSGVAAIGYVAERVEIPGAKRRRPAGRKIKIDPAVAPRVVKAYQMRAAGEHIPAIAAETQLFAPGAAAWKPFFKNRAYIGEFWYQGRLFTNVYPAMLARELFDAVQQTYLARQTKQER